MKIRYKPQSEGTKVLEIPDTNNLPEGTLELINQLISDIGLLSSKLSEISTKYDLMESEYNKILSEMNINRLDNGVTNANKEGKILS